MGWDLDESGADVAECCRKVASRRKVAVAIRPLVYARGLQLECAVGLHKGLLMLVLLYGSETDMERKGFRIKALQKDNLRGLLGIMRMDRVMNVCLEYCGGWGG